jgi:nucleotide-binding universal stress UspA family protein
MAKFTKILAPTDFSDPSARALEFALDVVEPGGELIILHVVDDTPLTYGYVGLATPAEELRTVMAREAGTELSGFGPESPPKGVKVQRRIVHGAPYLEIIRFAHNEKVDLIVMGTHGRTGIRQMLIGSVTEKVVRKAPCPVLVVHEPGFAIEHV